MPTNDGPKSKRNHKATGKPRGRPRVMFGATEGVTFRVESAGYAALVKQAAALRMTVPAYIRQWASMGATLPPTV